MGTLVGVGRKHPQYAYAGPQKPLQQEWSFVQWVTLGIGDAFGPVEKSLQETFLQELFEELGEGAPGRGVTRLPVKQAGMDLPDPTLTAPENWTTYCVITGHLVVVLRGQVEFRTADHSACLQEIWTEVWKRSAQWEEEALKATITGAPVQGERQL